MKNIFSSYVPTFLAIISLCPKTKSFPQESHFSLLNYKVSNFRELTTEIIFSLRRHSLSGQILTSNEELSYVGRLDGQKIHEAFVPSVVFGDRSSQVDRVPNATVPSSRYNSPNYMHINAQSAKVRYRRKRRMDSFNPNWKTAYSLTIGQEEFSELPDRLQNDDYFINFDFQHSNNVFGWRNQVTTKTGKYLYRDVRSMARTMKPNNVIWIQIELKSSPHPDIRNNYYQPHALTSYSLLPLLPRQSEISSYRAQEFYNFTEASTVSTSGSNSETIDDILIFHISCGEHCMKLQEREEDQEVNYKIKDKIVMGNDTTEPLNICVQDENLRLSPTACILSTIARKMNFPVVFSPGVDTDFENSDSESEIFKRNVPFRLPSENFSRGTLYNSLVFLARKRFNSLDGTMKPLSMISWLAIAAVTAGATLVFTLIKGLTMNNTDQSWYDYVVQQMLELMYEEKQGRKKFKPDECDDDDDEGRVSSPSVESRGKASKAVLHGTIRIVSFVLVAIYEGKLYNSITFPKARFVSSFDELLTNDRYAVKLSREAADVSLSIGPKNYSVVNRISESFNIDDCISWVEHSFSHGCIAYDFELRNLPKAQKVRMLNEEQLFAKTKTSIMASSRHKPSAILNPAAQISRWILEAGIFQFWMVAENLFTDNLITSKATKRKVFSIKDYVGLFAIYLTLLFIAVIVFSSEVILSWARKRVKHKSLLDLVSFCWQKVKECFSRLGQLWVQIKVLFTPRHKCCVKLKRIINNIV